MRWAMVGWSHHTTPVETREKLAFSTDQIYEVLQGLKTKFPTLESVLLSTCNRVELYCAAGPNQGLPDTRQLIQYLIDFHQCPAEEAAAHATALVDKDAIRHLFMVSASLDSMVVGEAQILSQVKSAYEIACRGDAAASQMHLAFQKAAMVAKRVSTETEIQKRRISIPSVAVSEVACDFFENFDDKRILVIGAGEMGTETLRYLKDAGANRITIVNRSPARAQTLAQEFGGEIVPWEQLFLKLVDADLVVSTTGASQPIVTREDLKAARSKKSGAVLILDLAVPRDFEPSISDLPDVYLFSVDDLQQVCDRNLQARQEEWPKAQQIVEQETARFLADSKHRVSGLTIKQLRAQAESIKKTELDRLLAKMEAQGVDESAQREVEIAFDRLVNKLLHPPMKSLREHADSSHHATLLDSLRRLFQLNE